MGQQDVLDVLEKSKAEKMSSREIGEKLKRPGNNINKLLKKLVDGGFVNMEEVEMGSSHKKVRYYSLN